MKNGNNNEWFLPVVIVGLFTIAIMGWIVAVRVIFSEKEQDVADTRQNVAIAQDIDADDDIEIDVEEVSVEEDTDVTDQKDDDEIFEDEFGDIIGGWESESYYVFNEDGTYGWYKSSDDLKDNYYSGTIEVLRGLDACERLGITFDKILTVIEISEGKVGLSDVYCITCTPNYLISGGVDKSSTLTGEGYDLAFIVTGKDSAQGMNVNTRDPYYFTKIK